MKTRTQNLLVICAWFAGFVLDAHLSALRAQGSLTPPGAPAPTMKSLSQIEPRTGITNLPFTITQGGSYYLTQSFSQAFATNAITITTNDVTLDFCGFTVTQTAANTFSGIRVAAATANSAVQNVVVKNGSVEGFANGVNLLGASLCVVEGFAANNGSLGIVVQANGTALSTGNLLRRSRAGDNSGSGFFFSAAAANNANAVEDCDAIGNGGAGFNLASINNLIIHCRASNNNTNYIIAADNDMGTIAEPIQNSSAVVGSKGGAFGIGVTDPFSNLSYP